MLGVGKGFFCLGHGTHSIHRHPRSLRIHPGLLRGAIIAGSFQRHSSALARRCGPGVANSVARSAERLLPSSVPNMYVDAVQVIPRFSVVEMANLGFVEQPARSTGAVALKLTDISEWHQRGKFFAWPSRPARRECGPGLSFNRQDGFRARCLTGSMLSRDTSGRLVARFHFASCIWLPIRSGRDSCCVTLLRAGLLSSILRLSRSGSLG